MSVGYCARVILHFECLAEGSLTGSYPPSYCYLQKMHSPGGSIHGWGSNQSSSGWDIEGEGESLGLLERSWVLADLEDCRDAKLLVFGNLSVCLPCRKAQGLDSASFCVGGMLVFSG